MSKPKRITYTDYLRRHGYDPHMMGGANRKRYREAAPSAQKDELTGIWTVLDNEPHPLTLMAQKREKKGGNK